MALLVDLDHAATTSVRPEVLAAMEPFAVVDYGNPSGSHRLARSAVRALDEARERTANLLGCRPSELVFTSGGTESDNQAVTGGMPPRAGTSVCSASEHHAVLDVVEALGGSVIPVDRMARIDLEALAIELDRLGQTNSPASLVSVMLANNEVGTMSDLRAVAEVLEQHAPHAALHTDAVQAAAWLDLSEAAAPAQLVSVSGHKLGGPKGIGALVVRTGTKVRPLLLGGGQERGHRSGTVNVAGAVGLAAALECTVNELPATTSRVRALRDRLANGLLDQVDGLIETVVPDRDRSALLPGTCHVCIRDVDSETLLLLLEGSGICASAGSSCASGASSGSHVVTALGIDRQFAGGALRLTLGHTSTDADVDTVLAALPAAVDRIRQRRAS
jgi:cysteine desulfurase